MDEKPVVVRQYGGWVSYEDGSASTQNAVAEQLDGPSGAVLDPAATHLRAHASVDALNRSAAANTNAGLQSAATELLRGYSPPELCAVLESLAALRLRNATLAAAVDACLVAGYQQMDLHQLRRVLGASGSLALALPKSLPLLRGALPVALPHLHTAHAPEVLCDLHDAALCSRSSPAGAGAREHEQDALALGLVDTQAARSLWRRATEAIAADHAASAAAVARLQLLQFAVRARQLLADNGSSGVSTSSSSDSTAVENDFEAD